MNESGFKKDLGLFDSTMIVAGSMIGSGIFIVSADIARQVNSGLLLVLVWILTSFITITGALSYGELAAAMPKAGGVYVYLKEAWNELAGFLFGWTLLLVIQTGTIAAVAVAFAKFAGVIFPWINSQLTIINFGNFHFFSTNQLIAIVSIFILTMVNTKGIKTGALLQNVFTVTKIVSLLGLIIVGLFYLQGFFYLNPAALAQTTALPNTSSFLFGIFSILAIASVGSLFSADAWFGITFVAGEVKNPSRNLPLALLLGTLLVCSLYVLANFAYLNVLGISGIKFAAEDRVATAALNNILGQSGAVVMAIVIMISTLGCNNGLIISGSRVLWAMAQDGLFFKSVGKLHETNHAPVNALILQSVWASALCLSGKYSQILDYIICTGLIFYILTILSIFRLRKTKPDMERPYKAFGYPILPLVYIILAGFIVVNLLLYKPLYCWPGLIIVLSGLPVYYFWKKIKNILTENTSEAG